MRMNSLWSGARLRELRQQAGLSQGELAAKAGLSQRSVSNWEQETREPSWSCVIAMARALGVSCEALLQEPAPAPDPKPGRPRKAQPEQPKLTSPKRRKKT
jgi:transcriptional regulator with XRE-family HTH domain